MSKHTQGLWHTCHMDEWRVSRAASGSTEAHAICDASGKIVAFAIDYSDDPFANLNTDHVSLIAAAPELLAALMNILECDVQDCLPADLVEEARTAIAKATGGAA
jgi:hypothetical protein